MYRDMGIMSVESIRSEIKELSEEIIKIRRQLHSNPELSYQEHQTSDFIASYLESLGLETRRNVGGTGLTCDLQGSPGGITLGFRADMDALPIEEQTGVPYSSKNSGIMHACGHDAHVAILLGAANILSKHRRELRNNIRLIFQPGEEDLSRGGALPMIEDGALDNPHVDHVFGLHIQGSLPSGSVSVSPGPIMAAPDSFEIKVKGKSGHGSSPDKALDPIFVSTQVINAIYGLRARFIDQRKPFSVSVCTIHAGTKDNIIPDELVMTGTMRTLDAELREMAKAKITGLVSSISESYGATGSVKFKEGTYPVTVNDPHETKMVREILSGIPDLMITETPPTLGAEDVSRFLELAPGCYFFLGSMNEAEGFTFPNHSSKFQVDDDVLQFGVESFVRLALEYNASV